MSAASADQEASTAAVTRSCFEKFQHCLQKTDGKTKIHLQTRVADLRLWADSVGAVAHEKASLDYRFQHRIDDISFIQDLLSMLEGFLEDMEGCLLTTKHKADLQDIMINIDSTIDTLAFIGVQIRRSGRKSRMRKADHSFNQNQDRYRNLRAHLACVILAKPTEEGRPKNEGKDIHSVGYFAEMKLSPIQERLIEANLRRLHRFKEAQRHSGRLKDHLASATPPVVPQHFIAISTTQRVKQNVSPLQDKNIATFIRQQSSHMGPENDDNHTIAPTSASGLDSKWGGLQEARRPEPTATCLTSTTAKMRYPRAHKLPGPEQKLAKCPCCCQAIPATELEGSRWRKHVANDLCPYTCVVANCPTPFNFFVTQEEWNNHVINDHPPHWQCPCCEDDPPIFESISGITHHLMTKHSDEVEADLEEFLSNAEISIMGITNCPLCDSEGPQDSLDLIEHVLQHVHDFSLRSLPWPADLPITLDRSAGLFDMRYAVKIVKDREGNLFKHDIAAWAEHVVPTFDQSRGLSICYDEEGKELILSTPSTLETTECWTMLQLHDVDRNTPKDDEESAQQDPSQQDYFSQFGNEYFMDESSDGHFSRTCHSSQQSGATERSTGNHGPKRWICPRCNAQSKPESSGEDDFFEHLIPNHLAEQAEIDSLGGKDRWMQYMLAEAYWLGIEAHSTDAVKESEEELDGKNSAVLSSVEPDIVKLLLDECVDVNAPSGQYDNALEAAAFAGHEQMVRLLLDKGADVNAPSGQYGNALEAASFGGHEQILRLLLDKGADVNAPSGQYDHTFQGKYEEAEVMHRQALAVQAKVLGREHPLTLRSIINLADVLNSQGKYEEAEAINRQTLAWREKVLGLKHLDTLTSMSNLADVLNSQGKYEEAEAINRQTLAWREKMLGPEHPSTLTSMSNLALVLNSQGKYKEAETINRQTLAWREKVLGLKHPSTLTSMSNLALVLNSQGKYEEAEAINRQTLAWREKVLGPKHPDTLMSMSNLADVLNSQDKYKEAETINRQTLAWREKVLGPEHPSTLTSMSNLALVLNSQCRYKEAEAINRQTLAQSEKVLGPEHPDTLTSMSNLALVLNSQGKYEEAEAINRQTLARTEKVLGRNHPDTLTSMSNLADILNSQGKHEVAETINRQTLAWREKVLGPEHPDTLTSMNHLADVLNSQGKYEEAEAINRQTLARSEKVLGRDHPDTLTSMYNLAYLLARQGHYGESLTLLDRACAAYSIVLGKNHPTTVACYQLRSAALASQEQARRDHSLAASENSASAPNAKVSMLSRLLAKLGSRNPEYSGG